MPAPSVPTVPTWQTVLTSAVTPSTTTVKKPTDIWGLGNAYGEPVLLGYSPASGPAGAELGMGGPVSHPSTDVNDVTKQTQQLMDDVGKMWASDPQGYAQLQAQLASAGYFGSKGTYVPGRFDSATKSALTTMLKDYIDVTRTGSGVPMTLSEFISRSADATAAAQAQTTQQKQVALDDPAAIRSAAQQAFQDSLGRAATEGELDKFVSQFQTAQQSAQLSTDSQVTVPNLDADAAAFAQSGNKKEFAQHQVEAYSNAILNLFLPTNSLRPNEAPGVTA